MKRLLIVFMFLLPGMFAFADDEALAGVSSLKVDLDQVVEFGTVSPVDGVTSAGQPDEAPCGDRRSQECQSRGYGLQIPGPDRLSLLDRIERRKEAAYEACAALLASHDQAAVLMDVEHLFDGSPGTTTCAREVLDFDGHFVVLVQHADKNLAMGGVPLSGGGG